MELKIDENMQKLLFVQFCQESEIKPLTEKSEYKYSLPGMLYRLPRFRGKGQNHVLVPF